MRIRTPYRFAAAAVGITLAGIAVALPATGATRPDSLQTQVNTVLNNGDVGVIAESTTPGGREYAAAGKADTATGTPANPFDSFRIGSATKTFVSTVMLQLVGEHRVSLDDTVDHWLPGVVSGNGNDGRQITVRELLQHTSGLYDYLADLPGFTSLAGFEANRYDGFTPAQLVAIAMRHAPDFAPGTQWEYSNTNYVLAGMIIQRVTGHTWAHEVTSRIIEPLGLRHTVIPGTDPDIHSPHLHGYFNFGTTTDIDVTRFNPSAADAAGEIISTTDDLTRFYEALLGGRLLAPAQLAAMETTVPAPGLTPIAAGISYGLGLIRIPLTCGGFYYGHGGDVPGYSTREGVSADGTHVVVAERTGSGSGAPLAAEHSMESLIDQQFCSR